MRTGLSKDDFPPPWLQLRQSVTYRNSILKLKLKLTAYLERFQMFVSANTIADDKLVPTLLTVVGSTHYTLIRGLVSPELPKDKSFDELVDILKKH